MATNQYTGARYVPIFAEPSEWNSTRTYEPLTIVLHEGNSFTSKQFVPAGIDITNEKFWAETGNYNGQVEQYRGEVDKYTAQVEKYIDQLTTRNYKTLVCPDDFDGSNDTEKINASLKYAYENGTGICLKHRTYTVNAPLTFYRSTYLEGNGATIVADGSFSLFLTTDDYSSNSMIKDLHIVGKYPTVKTSIAFDYESYSSLFTNLVISGFYYGFYQRNTLERKANQTGNMYTNIHTRNCAKGFYFGVSDNAHNTDGYMSNITACGLPALDIGSAAGWVINNLHAYGIVSDAPDLGSVPINLHTCGNTLLNNIYIEAYDVAYGIRAHVLRNVNISNVSMRTDHMSHAVYLASGTSNIITTAVLNNLSLSGNDDLMLVKREHAHMMLVEASNATCDVWYDASDASYITFKYGGFAAKSGIKPYLFDTQVATEYSERFVGDTASITIPFTTNIDGLLMVTTSHYGQGDPTGYCLKLFHAFKSKSHMKLFTVSCSDNITTSAVINDDNTITITATSTDANARGELKLIV